MYCSVLFVSDRLIASFTAAQLGHVGTMDDTVNELNVANEVMFCHNTFVCCCAGAGLRVRVEDGQRHAGVEASRAAAEGVHVHWWFSIQRLYTLFGDSAGNLDPAEGKQTPSLGHVLQECFLFQRGVWRVVVFCPCTSGRPWRVPV